MKLDIPSLDSFAGLKVAGRDAECATGWSAFLTGVTKMLVDFVLV